MASQALSNQPSQSSWTKSASSSPRRRQLHTLARVIRSLPTPRFSHLKLRDVTLQLSRSSGSLKLLRQSTWAMTARAQFWKPLVMLGRPVKCTPSIPTSNSSSSLLRSAWPSSPSRVSRESRREPRKKWMTLLFRSNLTSPSSKTSISAITTLLRPLVHATVRLQDSEASRTNLEIRLLKCSNTLMTLGSRPTWTTCEEEYLDPSFVFFWWLQTFSVVHSLEGKSPGDDGFCAWW